MKTMKNLINPLLIATALITTACTNTTDIDNHDVDPSGKTPISFVGENSNAPVTRAGFTEKTQIAMHIRSTKDDSNIKETRTVLNALKDAAPSDNSVSSIEEPSTDNIRYWDDAFGRDAKLSVFAVAVPGKTDMKNPSSGSTLVNHLGGNSTWAKGKLSEEIDWVLSGDQLGDGTVDILANEDLTYSNNIKNGGAGGAKAYDYTAKDWTDIKGGQMKFRLKAGEGTAADGPGKFDKGHLTFKHALSRITIHLIKGTGFGDNSFNLAPGTNITIKGVHTTGTLDIEKGTWALPTTTPTGISKMATTTNASGATHSLVAQMMPGFVINKDNDTNVLEFTIDGNAYYVTQDMMFNALEGKDGTTTVSNTITMEQGKNYVFNITVKKTQISNITASLQPWTDVKATDQTLDNSHGTISFSKTGTDNKSFDLYRMVDASKTAGTNWGGNYGTRATLTPQTPNGSVFDSNWFYENDESYYHFRSVNVDTEIKAKDTDVDDYFEMTSGDVTNHDYHWGAPLVDGATIAYEKDATAEKPGYAGAIHPAFRAITTDATNTINLTEFHMMSEINVKLQTTKTDNAVVLQDASNNQCVVALTNFYKKGQVKLGNGLVSVSIADGLTTSDSFTKPSLGIDDTDATYKMTGIFTYAVVPQLVNRNPGTIGLTITTPDGNVYTITDLSKITVSGASTAIDFWNPNHRYTYTFTLTKTGISNVTCTVQDWIKVTATDQNVSLE